MPDTTTMIEIDCSDSSSLGYAKWENGTLMVDFTKTGEYIFEDVPADIATDFANSESKGAYFIQNIKGNYDYDLADSEETPGL